MYSVYELIFLPKEFLMIKKMILGALCLAVVGTMVYGMQDGKKPIHSIKEMQEAHARMRQENFNNGVSPYGSNRNRRVDDADGKSTTAPNKQPIVSEKK